MGMKYDGNENEVVELGGNGDHSISLGVLKERHLIWEVEIDSFICAYHCARAVVMAHNMTQTSTPESRRCRVRLLELEYLYKNSHWWEDEEETEYFDNVETDRTIHC